MCQPQGPAHSLSSAYSSNYTGLGVFRRLTTSVEPWHLNSAAGAFVVTFLFVQFRALLRSLLYQTGRHAFQRIRASLRDRREASGQQSVGSSTGKRQQGTDGEWKQFADKQVGSDLDTAVEEHDNILQQSPAEVPYFAATFPESEMLRRSQMLYEELKTRRSVRCFSARPVSLKLVQNLVKTAGTAPSGANLQPWTFCVVQSGRIKRAIREVVEEQEQLNYTRRMGAQWVLDVSHLNVHWNKPYLTEAPFIVVVMKHAYQLDERGQRRPTYYSEQSTAIAVGMLLAAIQHAGLVTVVTTPLNAGAAIREILQRPINEKVSLLLPLGHPAEGVHVPDIHRKSVEEIMRIY